MAGTVSNATILQAATQVGTSDFQQFMDKLSQQTTKQVVSTLFDPMNKIYHNMFIDYLINRIGFTWVKKHSFENPLAVFKQNRLTYGNTVQILALDYIKTHEYSDVEPTHTETGDSLFKTYRPKGKAAYVSTNQFRQYPITVNDMELRQSFASDTGLNDYVAQVMRRPFDSDNYAEYRAMVNSFAAFKQANPGLVYMRKSPIADLNNVTQVDAQHMLMMFKTYADYMRFPNVVRQFVPGDMPATYNNDELVLLVKPELNAALDVMGLAQLFHIEQAQVPYRVIPVDDFGIPGCQAVLCSERTMLAMDYEYQNGSFYNPRTLNTSYFLTHIQIAGVVDPFEPMILFGTGTGWADSTIATATEAATGIKVTVAAATAHPGDVVDISVKLDGELTFAPASAGVNSEMSVAPDSATYEVSATTGGTGEKTPVMLNSNTYVDSRTNKLHIQKSGLASGVILTVKATGTYTDPTSDTPKPATPFTGSATITIN